MGRLLVTLVVCGVILLILVRGLIQRRLCYLSGRPVGELTRLAPTAAMSLGILGTFLGIFIGLLNFDTGNINDSIPNLLSGLQTAFLTSLVGMASSLVLKYQFGFYENKEIQAEKATSQEPVELLRQTAIGITSLSETVSAIGEAVVKCFRAEEEYSLLSQLKLIRTEMGDLRRDITKSLDEFGKKVAELGTEAMIKALQEVIQDFNTKLSDLVGAEFKQLKEAMIKLVDWQENHRQAVDQMQQQLTDYLAQVRSSVELLERASNSIHSTSEHLDSVDGSLSAISVSTSDLSVHVESLKSQNAQLAELLSQVRMLGEEAKTVLPTVSAHINEATKALSLAAENTRSHLEETSAKVSDVVTGVTRTIESASATHSEKVTKSLDEITGGLEKVLDTSLRSLAGQLAALSSKFTEDYTPLTDRLREVVRLSERIDHAKSIQS